MGLLFLTRHEARIVLKGHDEDPTWWPFPGSPLDMAWDGDDPDAGLDEALTERARKKAPYIEVNANSRFWRKHTRIRVLLVIDAANGGKAIVGVGNCATERRRGWLGTSSVRLVAWRLFSSPLPLDTLLQALSPTARNNVTRLFANEDSREMPEATAGAVWGAMRDLIPNFTELLAGLPSFAPLLRTRIDDLAITDAGASALRFFSPSWRDLRPVEAPPPPSTFALRLESTAVRNEDEVITDDIGFLDWDSDRYSRGGWYLFRSPDGSRDLRIKNINFKDAETSTGADLVYLRSNPESVVLVQYKLLTSSKSSEQHFFRDSGARLIEQVRQMLTFSTAANSDAGGSDDYRLGSHIGFVKFVIPTSPVRAGDELVIPDGRYHPAEGVLRMLSQPSRGPRGGEIHHVHEWRSLDGQTFANLVRDRWVGSAGTATDDLLSILGLDSQPLVLAVEEIAAT